MSAVNVGSIATPDLPSLLQQIKDDVMTGLNCHRVGQIQSFDVATQTATVTITQNAQVGGKVYEFPLLVDVPVYVMTGGATGVITMPIAPGDTCLVAFHDRDLDNWFATGNTTTPNTPRVHSLADGMAFVGFRSKANPVSDYSPTYIELRNLASYLKIGATIELLSAGKVRMESSDLGLVELTSTIEISNAATDLKSVLLLIIDALVELNTLKDGGDAGTAISNASAAIPTLLT